MMRPLRTLLAATFAILCIGTSSANWFENGIVLDAGGEDQYWPRVVSDDAGGVFVSWSAETGSASEIRMQRLDSQGNQLWGPGGIVAFSGSADLSEQPVSLAADGLGGAIITWQDFRYGGGDIFAQRVDASGSLLWGATGIEIFSDPSPQGFPSVVSDGFGGAYIGWIDERHGPEYTYVQKVSPDGLAQWAADGVPVVPFDGFTRNNFKFISFGTDGVVVVYNDNSAGTIDIYAQRFNFLGGTQWTAIGKKVCGAVGSQFSAAAIGDVTSGIIVAWGDTRGADADIYVQHLDLSGTAQWTADGVLLCGASGTQSGPQIATDGAGGAVVSWVDARGGDSDVYARRIDANGSPLWLYNGLLVGSGANNQTQPRMLADGSGGTFLTWQDFSQNNFNLYGQRLDASGNEMWAAGGVVFCDVVWDQQFAEFAMDGSGGIIAAWEDNRNVGPFFVGDIYAQRLEPDFGTWGFPEPVIDSVADVPDDQGGYVALNWSASQHDLVSLQTVTHYSIWRATDAIPKSDVDLLTSPASIPVDFEGSAYWVQQKTSGPYYWEWVGNQDALFAAAYSYAAPTRSNSTGEATNLHYFQVVTHDGVGVYASTPASGESFDNLAPATPKMFAGMANYSPEGLDLSWEANVEPDLYGYALYRGGDPNFIPDLDNLIASPTDPTGFDAQWSLQSGYYYKLSALDVHGNESGYALLSPQDPTSSPDVLRADVLEQNVPNPFNPATTLAYEIGQRGHVLLSIYDLAGRRIVTPVDEIQDAGQHRVVWDGRDAQGRAVSSGVYLYRMQSNGRSLTKRMVLVR